MEQTLALISKCESEAAAALVRFNAELNGLAPEGDKS